MILTPSLHLTRWISTLLLTATIPLVGCGSSDLPSTTSDTSGSSGSSGSSSSSGTSSSSGSSGSSSSSGTPAPSCPKDTSAASQLVAMPSIKAVAATNATLYFIAPNEMDFSDPYLYETPLVGGANVTDGPTGSASTLLTDGKDVCYVAGRYLILGSTDYLGDDGVDFVELALDETSYYILARDNNVHTTYIAQGPRTGGAPTKKIALPAGTARTIAVDGAAVYVLMNNQNKLVIVRAPIDGSAVTTVATDVLLTGIAVDATSLYYFKTSADTVTSELIRSDKTGGGATVLLSQLHSPSGLLLAGDLYTVEHGASDGEGKIQRISTQGDCGQVLATGQSIEPYPFTYSLLAVNATDVYWGTTDGVSHVTR